MPSIANSVKNKARLFFAIELPQEIKNKLEIIQQTTPVFSGRAVSPHNFHITLEFLGAIDKNLLHDLADATSIPAIKPFPIAIERYAYYPKTEIGCVEVTQGKQTLKKIKEHINQCLASEGLHFAKSKHSFRPHVTLFRDCQPIDAIDQTIDLAFEVESFCLMQSHQNEKGVYYEVIEEWPVYEPSIKEQFFGIKY